jgi:hypothetical protein
MYYVPFGGKITITFIWLFAYHFLFGRHIFKIKGSKTLNNLNTTDENEALTESYSISTRLCNEHMKM